MASVMKYSIQSNLVAVPLLFSVAALFATGCRREPAKRHYTEFLQEAPRSAAMPHDHDHAGGGADMASMPAPPPSEADSSGVTWSVPDGWKAQAGSGMRLVTLVPPDGAGECTIVSLGGAAGGVRSNIVRWLGQLEVKLSDAELEAFLHTASSLETADGLVMGLYDFSSVAAGSAKGSLLAGIVSAESRTVFVKYAGPPANLAANRAAFEEICRSLKLQSAPPSPEP